MSNEIDSSDVRSAIDQQQAAGEFTGDDSAESVVGYLPAMRRNQSMQVNTGSGVVDITGVKPPYLSIAYGVGGLSGGDFAPGDLVLAKEHLLGGKDTPLRIIVLKFEQYVKEYLTQEKFAAGLRPRLFKDMVEAAKSGLRVEWGPNSEKPEVSMAMDMMLLIEKPKDTECGLFGIELDGKEYALALACYDKTAYQSLALTFLQSFMYAMRGKKVWQGIWELRTKVQVSKKTQNKSWVPTFKLAGYTTEAQSKGLVDLFGSLLEAPLPKTADAV